VTPARRLLAFVLLGLFSFALFAEVFHDSHDGTFWGGVIRRVIKILFALRRRGLIPASFSGDQLAVRAQIQDGPRGRLALDKVSASGQGIVCSHCRGSVTFNQYIRGRTRQAIVCNSQHRLSKEIREGFK